MILNSFRIIECVHHSRRFVLYQAERTQDKKLVLIKTQDPMQINDTHLAESLRHEAEAAIKLSHPCIRPGIACFNEGQSVYMVAEYAPGMAMAEYLLQNPEAATPDQCYRWARDILHALLYAQNKGIYHYNINPYNVIIDAESQLRVIGFAKNRDAWKHAEGNLKYPYPMLYAAPEIFKTSNPHPNSDLYSWAVMVYQMFCRQLPWPLDRFMGPYEQKYQSMSRNLNGADSDLIPEAMYNVLRSCLKLDPADRPQDLKSLLFLLQEQVPQIEWSYIEPGADDVQEAEPDTTVSVTVRAEQILETPEEEENIKPEDGEEAEQADSAIAADAEELSSEQAEPFEESIKPEDREEAEQADSAIAADTEELSSEQAEPFEEEDVPIVAEDDEKRAEALNAFPEPNASSEPEPTDAIAQEELQDIQAVEENIQEDNQDLSNMRKFFIILMLISIAIVAYILIQHFLLRPKPSFEVTQDEIPQDVEEFTTETLTENKPLEMVWVPADTLIMGSIIPEADADEFPLLTIPLKGFMITPTELTQEQWNMVYSSNPSLNVGAHLPVENVSFYDAIDYCNAKSLKDGLNPAYDYLGTEIICDFDADGYRLPTEAEWEFAAKAGIGKNFMLYSGSDDPQEVAWYAENSLARSHIVATKQANALDLYDLSGNVYEWVWNWYAPYSYRISDLYSGPAEGTDKVIRGGSWYHNEDHLRTTSREYVKPYVKTGFIGFRMVRSR